MIFGSIGYGVSKIASYENYELFILIFAAPAVPILAIYVLVSLLIFSPTAYIMANNEGISAGEAIGACYRSMMNNGKMTLFLSYFISGLIKMLYLGAFGVGGYFLFTLCVPEEYFVITLIGYIVVALAGYLLFAPIFTLATRVLKEHMFEDIVLDSVAVMRAEGKINLSVCNGRKLQAEATNKNLASLFEYTEDPYKILAMTEKKSQEPVLDNIKVKSSPKKAKNGDSVKQPIAEEKVIKTADEEVTVQPETESEETPQPIEKPAQPTAESEEAPKSVETAPKEQSATEDDGSNQSPETPNDDGLQSQTETAVEN